MIVKRLFLAALVATTVPLSQAKSEVDPMIRAEQSALIKCNLGWAAKLAVQPGAPSVLAKKAQQLCASEDAAYDRVVRLSLRYKTIADRYMRKIHASQLRSNTATIVKVRSMMKKRKP